MRCNYYDSDGIGPILIGRNGSKPKFELSDSHLRSSVAPVGSRELFCSSNNLWYIHLLSGIVTRSLSELVDPDRCLHQSQSTNNTALCLLESQTIFQVKGYSFGTEHSHLYTPYDAKTLPRSSFFKKWLCFETMTVLYQYALSLLECDYLDIMFWWILVHF